MQPWGFSPVCVIMCCLIPSLSANLKPQISQLNGLTSLCLEVLWFIRFFLELRRWPQTSQQNNLDPECVLTWEDSINDV
uniref:Putative secreted protein n=1 Tax=Anopheles marajoara TaxID=58244 RepID=A0A2M4CC58_9DIPT